MVQPASKRLVTEANITDPNSIAGAVVVTAANSAVNAVVAEQMSEINTAVEAARESDEAAARSASTATTAAETATTMAGQTVALQDAAVAAIARDTSSQTRGVIDEVSATAGSQAAVQTISDQPEVVAAAAALAQSDAGLVRGTYGQAPPAVGGIVDASGNLTEIAFDRDGQVPESIVRAWATRMNALGRSVLPIVCWGDSQTGNDDSSAPMWTKVMATDLGVAVTNRGFPGETSAGIAAKSGAIPAVWASGGVIPASGTASVVLKDHVTVLLWWHPMKCTIAGVHGTLSGNPNIRVGTPSVDYPAIFARDVPGNAVTVPPNAPFIPDDVPLRANMTIIMAGRNNSSDVSRVLSDTAAMVDFLTGSDRKWAVLPQINGSGRDAINSGLKNAYGRHYWDMLPYLVSPQALTDAGIAPTQADLDAIAAGNIPPSFTSDGVHLNSAGLGVQGVWVAQKVTGALWLQ